MSKINQKQIEYWKQSALRTWKVSLSLYKNKHYDACLFFCHLSIEKLLKGLITKQTQDNPPYIHDLKTLAKIAKVKISEEQNDQLGILTTFNIAGRYSDVKHDFYKKCTKNYTKQYLDVSKQLFLWLKKEYQK